MCSSFFSKVFLSEAEVLTGSRLGDTTVGIDGAYRPRANIASRLWRSEDAPGGAAPTAWSGRTVPHGSLLAALGRPKRPELLSKNRLKACGAVSFPNFEAER